MDNIDRKQLDRICELLRENTATSNTNEKLKLADVLEKADIIPKLYQAAYVEAEFQKMKDVDEKTDLKEKFKWKMEYYVQDIVEGKPLRVVHSLLRKAHDRRDEICDFADAVQPEQIKGRCQYENHSENLDYTPIVPLSESQQKEFDKLCEDENSCVIEVLPQFIDHFNPDNQNLQLILDFGDDESKVQKDGGHYACDRCMEEIRDNSEGNISCDLDMVDD